MPLASLERLVVELRAAAAAGRAGEAIRLAFRAVHAAEQAQTSAPAALATEAWDDAYARVEVFTDELDRFTALATLLLRALCEPGPETPTRAERVLRAIEDLPTGLHHPHEDGGLVHWLAGWMCELGLSRPERLLMVEEGWCDRGSVEALLRQITGERPDWLAGSWEVAWPTDEPLPGVRGAEARLELALRLTEAFPLEEKHGRGDRARCLARIGELFARLGHHDRAVGLLRRALEETSRLDTAEFCDDAFDREPCTTAIASGCAALGGELAAGLLLEAQREAEPIDNEGWKAWAHRSVARAAARLGRPETASALLPIAHPEAEGLNPGHARAETLVSIAVAWARRGDRQQADEVLTEAWKQATTRYDPAFRRGDDRMKAMLCVAAGWGELGDPARAAQGLASVHTDALEIANPLHRALGLWTLAETHRRVGSDGREPLLESWSALRSCDDGLSPDACALLAAEWLRLGESALALEALRLGLDHAFRWVAEEGHGHHSLSHLLMLCGDLGAEARNLLEPLLQRAALIAEERRAQVFARLAMALGRSGDGAGAARALVRAIGAPRLEPTVGERITNLGALAEAHRRLGDHPRTEAAVLAACVVAAESRARTRGERRDLGQGLEDVLTAGAALEPDSTRRAFFDRAMALIIDLEAAGAATGSALAALAGGVARLDDRAHAASLLERALSLDPMGWVMWQLVHLVEPCRSLGAAAVPALTSALELALHGETVAKFETNMVRLHALRAVLEACVNVGDLPAVQHLLERATEAASAAASHVWSDPGSRASALLAVAECHARLGDQSRCGDLLRTAARLVAEWCDGETALPEVFQRSAALQETLTQRRRRDLARLVPLRAALQIDDVSLSPALREVVAQALAGQHSGGLHERFLSAVAAVSARLSDAGLRERVLQAIEDGCAGDDDDCVVLGAAAEAWASARRADRALTCLQRATDIAESLDPALAGSWARAWAREAIAKACTTCASAGVDVGLVTRRLLAAEQPPLYELTGCARHDPSLLEEVASRSASLDREWPLRSIWSALCDAALETGSETTLIPHLSRIGNKAARVAALSRLAAGIGERTPGSLETLLELLTIEPGDRSATQAVARAVLVTAASRGDRDLVARAAQALDVPTEHQRQQISFE